MNRGDDKYDRIGAGYEGSGGRYNPKDLNEAENAKPSSKGSGNEETAQNLKDSESSTGEYGNIPSSFGRSTLKDGKASRKKAFGAAGGVVGLLALLLGGGTLLLGNNSLINIGQELSHTNDSSSPAFERRTAKALFHMMEGGDSLCGGSKLGIKCKMGRLSHRAYAKLEKKGVKAVGESKYGGKRSGYPSKKPTHYEIYDRKTGNKVRTVKAGDMREFLGRSENKHLRRQVMGRRGAITVRAHWMGKQITKRFYGKKNIKLDGGMADGENKAGKNPKRTLAKAKERLAKRVPKAEGLVDFHSKHLKGKLEAHQGKFKKGGTAYMGMVAGCLAVKAPSFVAAAAAGLQLAQMLPVVTDVVLSPSSKEKVSGVDTENAITAEDKSAVMSLLTVKDRDSDGNLTAAVDSPYFRQAIGAERGNPKPSSKFSPGLTVLKSGIVAKTLPIERAVKDECAVILSPTTMYSFAAADGVITALTSSTIVLGVAKFVGSWVATELIVRSVSGIVGSALESGLKSIVENDLVPTAAGRDLGDVIGLSAMGFFSQGGQAHNLPTLSMSQVDSFSAVKQEYTEEQRQDDIASLSPFDTSSRYTFLGSITRNAQLFSITHGDAFHNIFTFSSMVSDLPKRALNGFSPAVSAARQNENNCGYAKHFGLDTGDPKTTPAITAAGTPCTGITTEQSAMSTETALGLLDSQLDLDAEIPDGATTDELVGTVVKKDSALAEYIDTCGDVTSGDYLFNSATCILPGSGTSLSYSSGGPSVVTSGDYLFNSATYILAGSGTSLSYSSGGPSVATCSGDDCLTDEGGYKESEVTPASDRELQAMTVFLLDYQIVQAMNEEDEEPETESEPTAGSGETDNPEFDPSRPLSSNWKSPVPSSVRHNSGNPYGAGQAQGYRHEGADFSYSGQDFFAACDGVVIRIDDNGDNKIKTYGKPGGSPRDSNQMAIDCGGGIITRYHHYLRRTVKPDVSVGSKVSAGQALAEVGEQGYATGKHLHFEVRTQDNLGFQYTKNPVSYLSSKGVSGL